MTRTWDTRTTGVLQLPSGRPVRGRGLRRPLSQCALPDFGLYLLSKPPARMCWDTRWLRWPGFWLPADQNDARDALGEAWRRAEYERVEVACGRGRGRTGTALACLAVLDGVPARGGRLCPRALRRSGGRDGLATPLRHAIQHSVTPSRRAILSVGSGRSR